MVPRDIQGVEGKKEARPYHNIFAKRRKAF
jgi:hypothetical protein